MSIIENKFFGTTNWRTKVEITEATNGLGFLATYKEKGRSYILQDNGRWSKGSLKLFVDLKSLLTALVNSDEPK